MTTLFYAAGLSILIIVVAGFTQLSIHNLGQKITALNNNLSAIMDPKNNKIIIDRTVNYSVILDAKIVNQTIGSFLCTDSTLKDCDMKTEDKEIKVNHSDSIICKDLTECGMGVDAP